MQRRLMITVDVEAQPARAEKDHVKRLIWGEYPEGRGGIGEMMDIGDRHGAPIVMFLDYCERAIYGDDILDVAREVHRRGHDLQIHSHPEFLGAAFWAERRLSLPASINTASDDQACALVEYLCESQTKACGKPPLGYRGGGYRYGPAILRALVQNGVMLDSSYIAARENQPLRRGRLRPFLWDNGCLEVPVSCVNPFLNLTRDFDLNFNASAFHNAERMMLCLEAFYQQHGDDAIATLVLHSWSFSHRQGNGFFSPPDPKYVERFDAFLGLLKKNGIAAISTAEALKLAASREIGLGPKIAIHELVLSQKDGSRLKVIPDAVSTPVGKDRGISNTARKAARSVLGGITAVMQRGYPVQAKSPAEIGLDQKESEVRANAHGSSCAVCQTPISEFEDYNGRAKSRCPKCGSVERQRVFVEIYDKFLRDEFDLRQKRVLALSPSNAERMIFQQREIFDVVSCDIQPELNTDLVADITNMPEVESSSFDCVIASYVLTCVHDLDSALAEINRVLKPGGRFLFCDPLRMNADTVETTELSKITSWYGQDAYDKYKIGSFRQLGDIGILKKLESLFFTKTLYGLDAITGTKWIWHSATKSKKLEGNLAAAEISNENGRFRKRSTNGDFKVDEPQFASHDALFRAARLSRPRLTYAQWSVENQIKHINEGNPHPSLGAKLVNNEWATAALSTFQLHKNVLPDFGPNSRVVDYGCGSLRLGHHFIRFLESDNYIGLDIWKDLIDMGVKLVDPELIIEKRPKFMEITPDSINLAIDSNADLVFACSVAYQVHPWDYAEFVSNLQKIAHKPGACIVFDTKLATSHFRYKESGWAWTQNFYEQLFDGFKLVTQLFQMTQQLGGREVDTHLFVYRRP
jgi:SAM-dependent methyltransferase